MDSFDVISPKLFTEKLDKGELADAVIIDVREKMEWDYYHLEEARLIPMNSIPEQLDLLPKDRKLYIICAHGVRSAHVCYFLQGQGFGNAVNVEGGIAAVAMIRGFQYD